MQPTIIYLKIIKWEAIDEKEDIETKIKVEKVKQPTLIFFLKNFPAIQTCFPPKLPSRPLKIFRDLKVFSPKVFQVPKSPLKFLIPFYSLL